MQNLVTALVRMLVAQPEAVRVAASDLGRDTLLELTVAPEDVGRVIGRQGRTIRSLRAVLAAACRDAERGYQLEVLEFEEG
ncbi:MAG: KH domain-containing protein [Terriglobales bacterium]